MEHDCDIFVFHSFGINKDLGENIHHMIVRKIGTP